MRCGGGGRASPPAPQGDPAPSCPDAVTKSHGRNLSPCSRQRPIVLAEAEPGPSPRAGIGRKWSGKSLEVPFATAWVPHRRQQQRPPSSLLPLCLCKSRPRRLWPHPLLQHEVIASQSKLAQQNTSGSDWLQDPPRSSPHSAYPELPAAVGQDGNRHFGETPPPPTLERRSPCRFSRGESLALLIFDLLLPFFLSSR